MVEIEIARRAVEKVINEAWALYAVVTQGRPLTQADIEYEQELFLLEDKLATFDRTVALL